MLRNRVGVHFYVAHPLRRADLLWRQFQAYDDSEANTNGHDTLKPERKAQLEEYAYRRGQEPAAVLDDALANYLEWDRQDYEVAAEGIRKGYAEVKAGRSRPAAARGSERIVAPRA